MSQIGNLIAACAEFVRPTGGVVLDEYRQDSGFSDDFDPAPTDPDDDGVFAD